MMTKDIVIATAQLWLAQDRIIIDTETTGLGQDAEIVEISAIDTAGNVLLDCLVKPTKPIPAEATDIHGITNEMVADAKEWVEVKPLIAGILASRGDNYIAYNSDYDSRLLRQTDRAHTAKIDFPFMGQVLNHECAMYLYSQYRGEPGKYNGFKWHKLTEAVEAEGVKVDGQAHRALADCLMTLGVIKAMAKGGRHA